MRPSAARGFGPRDPKGSQEYSIFLSGSGCALRGWAEGPARRPGGSTNRKNTASIHHPTFCEVRPRRASPAPLWRRCARGRRPKDRTAQSTAQFFAPCQPHCGSAVAPPVPLGTRKLDVSTPKLARGNSCRIGQVPTGRICPFKRAGDEFLREVHFFARLTRFIYIRLTAEIAESLL